jgi:hypothetical protein
MYKTNTKYKVLSPNGFVDFSGIRKVYKRYYHHIIFDDNTEIKCSNNHPFGKEMIRAETIKIGDTIDNKIVVYNEIVENPVFVYDLVDVDKGNLYYSNGLVSHNCSFLGSVDTLISAHKLRSMVYDDPIQNNKGLTIYENPRPKHDYVMTVDVSRGLNNDYSAFIIFDVTEVPYKVVGKYRNNTIKPMVFPDVIHEVAKNYNKAFVLVEVNDIGGQVADILHQDMEYDNLLMCSMRGRAGQLLGQGFSTKCQLGLKMTATTKKTGCSNLKAIIESDRLLIADYEIISELTTFIQKNNTFMAEQGANDDLAMCLVIFAWVVVQPYFKEMTSGDVRKDIADEERESIEEDMVPFGFINDGIHSQDPEDGPTFVDEEGNLWFSNEEKWAGVIEDQYGKMGYMWEYM